MLTPHQGLTIDKRCAIFRQTGSFGKCTVYVRRSPNVGYANQHRMIGVLFYNDSTSGVLLPAAMMTAIPGRPTLLGGCAGWAVTLCADEDVLWLPILVLGLECSSAGPANCLIAQTNSAFLGSAATATSAESKPNGFDRFLTSRCVDSGGRRNAHR